MEQDYFSPDENVEQCNDIPNDLVIADYIALIDSFISKVDNKQEIIRNQLKSYLKSILSHDLPNPFQKETIYFTIYDIVKYNSIDVFVKSNIPFRYLELFLYLNLNISQNDITDHRLEQLHCPYIYGDLLKAFKYVDLPYILIDHFNQIDNVIITINTLIRNVFLGNGKNAFSLLKIFYEKNDLILKYNNIAIQENELTLTNVHDNLINALNEIEIMNARNDLIGTLNENKIRNHRCSHDGRLTSSPTSCSTSEHDDNCSLSVIDLAVNTEYDKKTCPDNVDENHYRYCHHIIFTKLLNCFEFMTSYQMTITWEKLINYDNINFVITSVIKSNSAYAIEYALNHLLLNDIENFIDNMYMKYISKIFTKMVIEKYPYLYDKLYIYILKEYTTDITDFFPDTDFYDMIMRLERYVNQKR